MKLSLSPVNQKLSLSPVNHDHTKDKRIAFVLLFSFFLMLFVEKTVPIKLISKARDK